MNIPYILESEFFELYLEKKFIGFNPKTWTMTSVREIINTYNYYYYPLYFI